MTTNAGPPGPDIHALTDWILAQGLDGTHFEDLLETLCLRLVEAGVPLLRANFSMRAHHPEVGAFAYRWKRKDGMIHEQYRREGGTGTGWDQSPLKHLVESDQMEIRYRLTPEHRPFAFPMFEELTEQGATDYFAMQLIFSDQSTRTPGSENATTVGLLVSWASDAPEGFSENDLNTLRGLLPALGLALKSNANYKMAADLLSAYLGADAGQQVMSGNIVRGSLQSIGAVILYFDLQGFTKLTEAVPGPDLIEMLNDYLGAVVPIIEDRGGNVLKFMGDGVLAIFARDRVPEAEDAAVETILGLKRAFADINARRTEAGLPVTGFSAAAHAGDVLYGNIGSSARLDFTVIGPAVNTTARIMGMCSLVDQPIVIGAEVARPLMQRRTDLVSLGQYRLRGVASRQELFTLD